MTVQMALPDQIIEMSIDVARSAALSLFWKRNCVDQVSVISTLNALCMGSPLTHTAKYVTLQTITLMLGLSEKGALGYSWEWSIILIHSITILLRLLYFKSA